LAFYIGSTYAGAVECTVSEFSLFSEGPMIVQLILSTSMLMASSVSFGTRRQKY